jgi:hypothetical protein
MMFVLRVLAIQPGHESPQGFCDLALLLRVAGTIVENSPRHIPNVTFRRLQLLHQLFHWQVMQTRTGKRFPPFLGDTPDATVEMIPAGVAEFVLHVADDFLEEVRDVDRTVGSHFDVHRAEIRLIRVDQERLQFPRSESGTVVAELVEIDGLVLKRVEHHQAAVFFAEMAAVQKLITAGFRSRCTGGAFPRLTGNAAGIEMPDPTLRPFGQKTLAPLIESKAPGIGRSAHVEKSQPQLSWLQFKRATVIHAHYAPGRFHLRVQKDTREHVQPTIGTPAKGADGVVIVFRAESAQQNPHFIRTQVAIGVAQKQ